MDSSSILPVNFYSFSHFVSCKIRLFLTIRKIEISSSAFNSSQNRHFNEKIKKTNRALELFCLKTFHLSDDDAPFYSNETECSSNNGIRIRNILFFAKTSKILWRCKEFFSRLMWNRSLIISCYFLHSLSLTIFARFLVGSYHRVC